MKSSIPLFLALGALAIGTASSQAGVAFPNPTNGWAYIFQCDQYNPSPRRPEPTPNVFDGTWNHQNSSSEWGGDGIATGDGRLGGVGPVVDTDGTTYLSIIDANRSGSVSGNSQKLFFSHGFNQDGVTTNGNPNNLMNTGITISFRARLTPNNPELMTTSLGRLLTPTNYNGYGIFSDGKGMFGVRQGGGPAGMISFSLVRTNEDTSTTASEDMPFGAEGLTMNRLAGDTPVGGGNGVGPNSFRVGNGALATQPNPIVPVVGITNWHEFWITIEDNGVDAGTHRVTVFKDGSALPSFFDVTAGTGNDQPVGEASSYICMGLNNTATVGGFDVDFYAYKPGIHLPPGAENNLPIRFLDVKPAANEMHVSPQTNIAFRVNSSQPIATNTIKLLVNGGEAQGLIIAGTETNRTVVWPVNLATNVIYNITLSASNLFGVKSSSYSIDTFDPSFLAIEGEDYNYGTGVWQDPPEAIFYHYPIDYSIWTFANSLLTAGNYVNNPPPCDIWKDTDIYNTGKFYYINGEGQPGQGYLDRIGKSGSDYFEAAAIETLTITVTGNPANGATFVLNGTTRTWTNVVTEAGAEILNTGGTLNAHAAQLSYNILTALPIGVSSSGVVYSGSNVVTVTGTTALDMSATVTGWGTVSSSFVYVDYAQDGYGPSGDTTNPDLSYHDYRINDTVGTRSCLDNVRPKYKNYSLTVTNEIGGFGYGESTNILITLNDYQLFRITAGEWTQYTRQFPTSATNLLVYIRAASSANNVPLSLSRMSAAVGGTTNLLGQFLPNTGSIGTFRWFPLTSSGTNVVFNYPGIRTLRLSNNNANNNVAVNFMLFAPPQPAAATPAFQQFNRSGSAVTFKLQTELTRAYTIQYRNAFGTGTQWLNLQPPMAGDGTLKTITDTGAGVATRYYRLIVN